MVLNASEEMAPVVTEVIRQVTGLAVAPDASFFTAGLTSNLVVSVHAALQHRLSRAFPVAAFFRYPTVSALAGYLAGAEETAPHRYDAVVDLAEPIAVVGMACRFPGARDVEEFWRNLVAGKESVTFFTPEQLRAAGVPEEQLTHPDYVPAAPVIDDVELFDADLFGMTPAEARMCDPQIRIFLELCHAALENAGYDPFGMASRVGVFGTVEWNEYMRQIVGRQPDLIDAAAGGLRLANLNFPDYVATRVSHTLNLRGPSMTVLTACSSSLVATHLGMQALRAGDCDAALAGGAVLRLPQEQGHMWTPGKVQTRDGHCRPFDASGLGTIFGSGGGVVVLKRLSDAVLAGDDIRAIIRGSAVNNDGADKVYYTAPSVSGQVAAIVAAMRQAGADPAEVDYVEAHATGTSLGDPIEVSALAEAYTTLAGRTLAAGRTALGSVKSNIGHMAAVAGMAGLIKTVLMLERGAIVPSIGVTELNPRLELASTPFTVATSLRPWERRADRQRVAAVSSLGIGGTNAHVVLTEGPAEPDTGSGGQPRVVLWSARTERGVDELRDTLARFLVSPRARARFDDVAATLRHGRTSHPVRAAVVASSAEEAVAALAQPNRVVRGHASGGVRAAFLFPGQGAQRARMAAGLYGAVREFSIAMDECLDLFEQCGVPLHDAWAGDEAPTGTAVVQPLLFSVEYALAEMWSAWGVAPDAVLGHSVGELTAAAVAGVFALPDAVALVAARAAAMAAHPVAGGMLAVRLPVAEVTGLLSDGVVVAAVNGPDQVVLSGPGQALDAVAAELAGRGVGTRGLAVAHAFHHPGWQEAADRFREAVAAVPARAPRLTMYSAATGTPLTEAQAGDASFWADQLVRPVHFWPALRALLADADRLPLEVGPGTTLSVLAKRRDAGHEPVATLRTGEDDQLAVLRAAARLWACGLPVDWEAAGQPVPDRRIAVPGYPYQRERYWIDPRPEAAEETRTGAEPVNVPTAVPARDHEPAVATESPFTTVEWVARPRQDGGTAPGGTALVLLPADPDRALDVLLATEQAGYRTVRVRPGDRYDEVAGEFRIRLDEPADVARVVTELTTRGIVPDAMVHAVASAPPTAEVELAGALDAAVTSLLALARATTRRPAGHTPPRVTVITSGSVDVSGNDPLVPANAAAHGVLRTLLAEAPGLRGAVVDVGDRVPVADLAAELRVAEPERAVALRGHRRWVPVERELDVPDTHADVVRARGVYLITGGFGGLGLAVARGLAATGRRPRLVLLGRRNPLTDPGHAAHAEITELRALGAEVLPIACDLRDPAATQAAVTEATTAFGPLSGVFHLAGVAGGQMIAFRDPAEADAVLAPKTAGTAHLLEALRQGPSPDFVVFFSSRAAVEGLVGSADYAAANGFLDAVAQVSQAAGRVLSIGWPVWLGAGMAGASGHDITGLADRVAGLDSGAGTAPAALTWEGEFGTRTNWVLDEHRVDRAPLMPGTGMIDLVVRLYTEKLAEQDAAVELTDVVFRTPFGGDGPNTLRVVFTQDGDGYEFEVSSGQGTHTTGRVASVPRVAATTDVDAVRDRLTVAGADSTNMAGNRPFNLGPRWRNVSRAWRVDDETLVRLELMAAFTGDLDEHRVHPALLDNATAAVCGPDDDALVPFMYRRIVLHRDLPGAFYSHIHRRAGGSGTLAADIELVAEDGSVVAGIEGFTMRHAGFADRAGAGFGKLEPPERSVRGQEQKTGLTPQEGVQLLMRLLAGRTPPSVLVRHHRDGRPVSPAVPAGTPVRVSTPAPPVHPVEAPPPTVEPAPVAVPTVEPVPSASNRDRLGGLWERALGTGPASDEDDFFDKGGDSIAAVELMARIRSTFGIELGIGPLLDARTFGALLALVEEQLRTVA